HAGIVAGRILIVGIERLLVALGAEEAAVLQAQRAVVRRKETRGVATGCVHAAVGGAAQCIQRSFQRLLRLRGVAVPRLLQRLVVLCAGLAQLRVQPVQPRRSALGRRLYTAR